jgi:hypothetical protein
MTDYLSEFNYLRYKIQKSIHYKKNSDIMREFIHIQLWNSEKIIDINGKIIFFKCLTQISYSKFSVSNQREENLWETLKYWHETVTGH